MSIDARPAQNANATQLQIYFLALVRWVNNVNLRMLYPFLAVFARGMGVDLIGITMVASFRFLLAMFSPLLAPLADRFGRKVAMLIGLVLYSVSLIVVSLFPTYPVFFVTHCTAFVGGFLTMTSIQAYLGDHVPYERRAQAFGTTEMGWSLAFLLGMPLVAFLIRRFGWSTPFPLLAILGLLMIILMMRIIPADTPTGAAAGFKAGNVVDLLRQPVVRVALGLTVMMGIYSEVMFIIFGVWMEDAFGLLIAGLGFASALLGISELGGELMVLRLSDRLGKGRAIQIGVLGSAAAAVAMILMPGSLVLSMAGLFLFTLGFEFAYVSSIPLLSDIVQHNRAAFLGINAAALALGRGLATVVSPLLYNCGIQANLVLSIAACGGSLLLAAGLIRLRREAGQAV